MEPMGRPAATALMSRAEVELRLRPSCAAVVAEQQAPVVVAELPVVAAAELAARCPLYSDSTLTDQ